MGQFGQSHNIQVLSHSALFVQYASTNYTDYYTFSIIISMYMYVYLFWSDEVNDKTVST